MVIDGHVIKNKLDFILLDQIVEIKTKKITILEKIQQVTKLLLSLVNY